MDIMVQKNVQAALHKVKTRAKSNDKIYNFVYDIINAADFTDFYTHERMLADSVRVESYVAAIRQHVSPDDIVIDLGTGTGLLAMLAAEQAAKVYAIEHSGIIQVAEQAADHNDIHNIEFRQVHSRDFNCPEPVDVILHEQFGDDLFDENLVENILDLKRRCLKPDGTVLPGRFELFLEPVTLKEAYRIPHLSNISIQGVSFDFLQNNQRVDMYKPDGYKRRTLHRAAFESFLSTPEPILSIDLMDLGGVKSIPVSISASRRVTTPGVMDGLCLYFRVLFDEGTQFSTALNKPRTHWRSRLLRTPLRSYEVDEEIEYTVSMKDLQDTGRWSISIENDHGDPVYVQMGT